MTRVAKAIRSRMAVSVGATLLGILLGVYGIEGLASVVSLAGILFLGLSIHQFGRLDEDA